MSSNYSYNLHAHSLLSDGALLPSEVAMRYQAKGYKVIAITDHADYSNIELVCKSVLDFIKHWPKDSKIKVISGIELTHLPPAQFKPLAKYARAKGIKVIIAHGESPVEPVIAGTNKLALQADIDILAHPGDITGEDVSLAKEKGIFLELTSRRGHSETNQHVKDIALRLGAKLILNNDSHDPEDIITPEELVNIGIRCGLTNEQIGKISEDVVEFLKERRII